MNCIPAKLKKELADDPFYEKCCYTGRVDEKIEWHHAFIYAGRQVNEKWCIIPLIRSVHKREKEQELRKRIDWIIFNRATDEQLKKYSKAVDYLWIRNMLNKKYGKYKENWYLT